MNKSNSSHARTMLINVLCRSNRRLFYGNECAHEKSYAYWGEYPLSFAACLGLIDCYKLLLAKGADPNRQDSNGNTTLHMTVIADRIVSSFLTPKPN